MRERFTMGRWADEGITGRAETERQLKSVLIALDHHKLGPISLAGSQLPSAAGGGLVPST